MKKAIYRGKKTVWNNDVKVLFPGCQLKVREIKGNMAYIMTLEGQRLERVPVSDLVM